MEKIHKIFDLLLSEGIHTYKTKNTTASLPQQINDQKKGRKHKKGAIGVIRSKEDLLTPAGVKGYVITSKETLLKDFSGLSHWTPNPYNYLTYQDADRRFIQGHTEDNLQQINTFVVDIDTKKQPYTEILTAAHDSSIGAPTLVLETPKGYQVYFVLESPLFISNQNDYRGLRVAKRISENIRRSLSKVLQGVDLACNDFGFFRMPNEENVRWFNGDCRVSLNSLINWSKRQDDDQGRDLFLVETDQPAVDPTTTEWFQALVTAFHVKGCSGQIGRDNLMYTLALACYSAGKGESETLNLLDEYNTALNTPVRHSQVRKTVKSAYKGRFKGASATYIRELLDTWRPGKDIPVTTHAKGWHKFKKERKDRVRSHYDEWESDVLAYIQNETSTAEPVKWTTQTELCKAVGIPKSTLNVLLRKSNKILHKKKGKGRGAQTGLTSVAVLVQCALEFNQTHRARYYEAVALMTAAGGNEGPLRELEIQLDLLTWIPPNRNGTGKFLNSS